MDEGETALFDEAFKQGQQGRTYYIHSRGKHWDGLDVTTIKRWCFIVLKYDIESFKPAQVLAVASGASALVVAFEGRIGPFIGAMPLNRLDGHDYTEPFEGAVITIGQLDLTYPQIMTCNRIGERYAWKDDEGTGYRPLRGYRK